MSWRRANFALGIHLSGMKVRKNAYLAMGIEVAMSIVSQVKYMADNTLKVPREIDENGV